MIQGKEGKVKTGRKINEEKAKTLPKSIRKDGGKKTKNNEEEI